MYKHLLVPVDGSDLSAHAAAKAAEFARSIDARITFLHVQPDYPNPIVGEGGLIAPELREDFQRGTQELAEATLRKVRQFTLAAQVDANSLTVVSDTPWQIIIRTAQEEACDLIFMASHGRRGLAGLLIGSETHKVLTHTTIPVLVYREA